MNDKIYSILGMAQKAGRLISGESMVVDSIRSGNAKLVIVAGDASDNSKKLYTDKCGSYNVKIFEYGEKEKMGYAIGKAERSAVAVEDEGFAKAILKVLD